MAIGETANATYKCDGTSTNVNIIESILPQVGMRCDSGRSWDWGIISNSLKNGKIVQVSAQRNIDGKKSGHAWIMDGYIHTKIEDINNVYIETIYVHHNFGWSGNWDGYYEIENPLEFTSGGNTYNSDFRIHANISKK